MTEPAKKSRILIVDDIPGNIKMLMAILMTEYELSAATNGPHALQVAQSNEIDLVLLDVAMPGMNGFEVCAKLKENVSTRDIPVIFVTNMDDMVNEAMGLELGAEDYIVKPITPAVLQARVKIVIERHQFSEKLKIYNEHLNDLVEERTETIRKTMDMVEATNLALDKTKQELEKLNQHLMTEREVIEDIITNMQNSRPFNPNNLRHLLLSMEKTSGDLLLSEFRPDGSQHVMLGDFTGHGLTAAIGGPLVADTFYNETKGGASLDTICSRLNHKLFEILRRDMFMAGVFLEISPDRSELKALNCGMFDILIIRNGAVCQSIPSNNLPRGVLIQTDVPAITVPVHKGDRIFVYSDGVVEGRNLDGEPFGMSRLQELLEHVSVQNQPLEVVAEAIVQFRAGAHQKDDISLVELTC